MWLLCLTHDTCQFGPTIIAGLRIQIVKLVIIQHPITTILHTKFFPAPTSHTTGVIPLYWKAKYHPYKTCSSSLTF
jgi:hypothetical protein